MWDRMGGGSGGCRREGRYHELPLTHKKVMLLLELQDAASLKVWVRAQAGQNSRSLSCL